MSIVENLASIHVEWELENSVNRLKKSHLNVIDLENVLTYPEKVWY